jgi:hypothetical protein
MVLKRRLFVSLVGEKCGGQSFDYIITVARKQKSQTECHAESICLTDMFKIHVNILSIYIHLAILYKVVDIIRMADMPRVGEKVAWHEWKFVVFCLLGWTLSQARYSSGGVVYTMKHLFHALCSGHRGTKQSRPPQYFRGRTAAQSSCPSFSFYTGCWMQQRSGRVEGGIEMVERLEGERRSIA